MPFRFAGLEIDAHQAGVVGAVNVVADAHHAAVLVGQVLV